MVRKIEKIGVILMQVVIRLADICNLKCRMCGFWDSDKSDASIMSLDDFSRLLDKLKETRIHGRLVDTLRLDGNREGLCYPYLAEAVKMSKVLKIPFQIMAGSMCW